MTAVTCARPDLKWALAAVLPHAARNDDLPEMEAVRLELDADGTLYVIATDRFTLGCAIVPCQPDGPVEEPGVTLLAAADVRELVKRLARKDDSPAALHLYADGDLSVDYAVRYAPLRYALDSPWKPGQIRGGFPDWRKLLSRALHADQAMAGESEGLNPEFLGRYAAARRPGCIGRALAFTPVRFRADGWLSVLVTGDRFAGLAAGVRMDRGDPDDNPREVLADWRERLPEVAK